MSTRRALFLLAATLLGAACTTPAPPANETAGGLDIMLDSTEPGTSVRKGDTVIALHQGRIAVGDPFPDDAFTNGAGQQVKLAGPGPVRLVSIVPSIKTKVCEVQSHQLDESRDLHPRVQRISISRDSAADQAAFATAGKLTKTTFLADGGAFGRNAGLLMVEKDLLARAVLVVDTQGIVQYIQVVPDIGRLPDLESAIAMANGLVTIPPPNPNGPGPN